MIPLSLATACALSLSLAAAADWTAGMTEGKPSFKSMGPLAFGPDGVLFVGDSKSASVVAIATGDTGKTDAKPLRVEGISNQLAALLGASADQIIIDDLAVNPLSHNAYLAVSRGRGPDAIPVLIKVGLDGKPSVVKLDKVKHSTAQLPDPPVDGMVGRGRRAKNPRMEAITDLAFLEDRLLIAGLANEEFASSLRAIPFPFKKVSGGTTVEIYHGAHGKFETRSPVRTFVPFNISNEPHLLAAYTCTPLVQFPVKNLTPGAQIRGKTIAELGNWNRPLDMIIYKKGGKDFLLIANNARGIMKFDAEKIEAAEGIETKISGTGGLSYDTIDSWKGVTQLAQLGKDHALVLRTDDDEEPKTYHLESLALP